MTGVRVVEVAVERLQPDRPDTGAADDAGLVDRDADVACPPWPSRSPYRVVVQYANAPTAEMAAMAMMRRKEIPFFDLMSFITSPSRDVVTLAPRRRR